MRELVAAAAVVTVLFGTASSARAESITVGSVSISSAGSSPFTWAYNIFLSAGSSVQTGDYFALLDWYGYIAGTASQPTGWTFTSSNTLSDCPFGQDAVCSADDPTIGNLQWTYSGPTIFGQTFLGAFSVEGTSDTIDAGLLVAQDHGFFGVSGNNQTVPVPQAVVTSVPEPALGLLFGIGGFALFLGNRRESSRVLEP
jgi:hypothetical protein